MLDAVVTQGFSDLEWDDRERPLKTRSRVTWSTISMCSSPVEIPSYILTQDFPSLLTA